jgi:flagellar biosynthesis/type III secretory pathway chaperone
VPNSTPENYRSEETLYLEKVYASLQRMIGLHRQLYEICKQERVAYVAADVKAITEQTQAKELVIETIRQAEADRIRASTKLAIEWSVPLASLTLTYIVQELEPRNAKLAESFRSALTALTVLIDRAKKQNASNRELLERSLEHVHAMKKNVLGEAVPASDTYGNQGQKVAQTGGARLLSTEA